MVHIAVKKNCVDFDFIPLIHYVNTLLSLHFILMFIFI